MIPEEARAVVERNPPARDQAARNVAAYERIYAECLRAAERITGGTLEPGDPKQFVVLEVSGRLFSRFWEDQVQMAKQQPTNELIQNLGETLRTRLAM